MRNQYSDGAIEEAIEQMAVRELTTSRQGVAVYLVVMDRGGLFGAFLDFDRAREAARNINGVLVALPIAEDYRS